MQWVNSYFFNANQEGALGLIPAPSQWGRSYVPMNEQV